jgi:hypothetical protein
MSTPLFDRQVNQLDHRHFMILYWVAQAEGRGVKYNLTNCFDDLKYQSITRTKQNAMAAVEALSLLCFVEVREDGNRKNLYITQSGAKALEALVLRHAFTPTRSAFLEGR